MTGVEIALVATTVAAAAGSAYVGYEGSRNQAKLGRHSEGIKQEQLAMERRTQALQGREQEAERQRRAGVARSAGMAGAAASGLDYWLSPSIQAADAENDRLVRGDVSAIRLLGAAGQRRSLIETRVSETAEGGYAAMGANAWIAPTISLVGDAAKTGMAMGPGRTAPKGDPSVATTPERLTGRAAGRV